MIHAMIHIQRCVRFRPKSTESREELLRSRLLLYCLSVLRETIETVYIYYDVHGRVLKTETVRMNCYRIAILILER